MSPMLSWRQRLVDERVLVPVVDAAQDGAVAELIAQGRQLGVERLSVHLAQTRVAKTGRNGLHLAGHGGVVIRRGGVVCPHLHEAEGIAKVLEAKLELLGLGLAGVLEVHERQAAQAHGRLVHEATGLAVVVILRALRCLGERHGSAARRPRAPPSCAPEPPRWPRSWTGRRRRARCR